MQVFPASVIFWLFLICISYSCKQVNSQQSSPLLGQNPTGPPPGSNVTDVYISILFQKLLSVDAINYQFTVQMIVATSWRDSRINNLTGVADVSMATERYVDFEQNYDACVSNFSQIANQTAPETVWEQCKAAASQPSSWMSNCNKPCSIGGSYLCCDLLWIPNLTFSNIVYLSQDRFVEDTIYCITGAENSSDYQLNETGGVIRTVEVQATFTAGFLFQRFPFDSQTLIIGIERGYSTQFTNLIPSGVAKGATSLFNSNGGKSDELPSWVVTSLEFTCDPLTSYNSVPDFNVKSLDPNDLIYSVQQNNLYSSGPYANTTPIASACELRIYISRLSAYYIWSTLFPLVCGVHLCFLPLFISPHKLDLRLTISVTLFLALTALQFTTSTEIPSSSYLTAYSKLVLLSYSVLVALSMEFLLAYNLSTWKKYVDQMGGSQTLSRKHFEAQSTEYSGVSVPRSEGEEDSRLGGISEASDEEDVEQEGVEKEQRAKKGLRRPKKLGHGVRKLTKSRTVHRVTKALSERHEKLVLDSTYGFRIARVVDQVSCVVFPLTYWAAILGIFLRG